MAEHVGHPGFYAIAYKIINSYGDLKEVLLKVEKFVCFVTLKFILVCVKVLSHIYWEICTKSHYCQYKHMENTKESYVYAYVHIIQPILNGLLNYSTGL